MKRGELSMEVIIIAAIALLVLVILSVLIIRSGGSVATGTSCLSPSIGGRCGSDAADCASDGRIPSTNSGCGDGEVCCIPLVKES
jgi:hypothetical protein